MASFNLGDAGSQITNSAKLYAANAYKHLSPTTQQNLISAFEASKNCLGVVARNQGRTAMAVGSVLATDYYAGQRIRRAMPRAIRENYGKTLTAAGLGTLGYFGLLPSIDQIKTYGPKILRTNAGLIGAGIAGGLIWNKIVFQEHPHVKAKKETRSSLDSIKSKLADLDCGLSTVRDELNTHEEHVFNIKKAKGLPQV
jgi:hypothetical protein